MLACCLVFEAKGYTSKNIEELVVQNSKQNLIMSKKIEELIDHNQNRDRELKTIVENK